MNVLIVGGAGFIGSHIAKALSKASFNPITYDNLSFGHPEAVRYGPLVKGEIHDTDLLVKVLSQYRPIALFHSAALTAVGESVQHPAKYYWNNVVGTIHLLEALRTYGPIPFLFSSTCAIYGLPKNLPLNENHPKNPINPYGRSKYMIEQIIDDYHQAYNMPYAHLRYFNAAGSDLNQEIGEDHEPENHLIPLILDALLNQTKIQIFGNDYDTKDGTAVRDYIHVQDLADAHVKALNYLLAGNKTLELNLGSGVGYSVQEIISQAEMICQCSTQKMICARREGDPPVLIADPTKAKELLNWQTQHSDLPTIISSAWEWRKKRCKKLIN